ncbi:MAG: hypothetical protein WCP97_07205 [bacterium]
MSFNKRGDFINFIKPDDPANNLTRTGQDRTEIEKKWTGIVDLASLVTRFLGQKDVVQATCRIPVSNLQLIGGEIPTAKGGGEWAIIREIQPPATGAQFQLAKIDTMVVIIQGDPYKDGVLSATDRKWKYPDRQGIIFLSDESSARIEGIETDNRMGSQSAFIRPFSSAEHMKKPSLFTIKRQLLFLPKMAQGSEGFQTVIDQMNISLRDASSAQMTTNGYLDAILKGSPSWSKYTYNQLPG